MKLRKEFDSIGSINVPNDKYWGASTQRSNKFFNIGKILVNISIIRSIAIIKRSAAIVHARDKLIDGIRFYDFPIGDGSYWLQRHSRHSRYPLPSGEHLAPDYESINQDIINFYNYPNPITDRETTFRFKVNNQTNISINIYNLSGHKVDNLTLSNPTAYEYNEIDWNIGNLLPGLYFADIIADGKKEKIIKVVIGY